MKSIHSDAKDRQTGEGFTDWASLLRMAKMAQIKITEIDGSHPALDESLVDPYPAEQDDVLGYSPAAWELIVRQHPLWVVRMGARKLRYQVVGGLLAWRVIRPWVLALHQELAARKAENERLADPSETTAGIEGGIENVDIAEVVGIASDQFHEEAGKTEKSDKAKAKRYMATRQSIPPLTHVPAMVLQAAPNTKVVEEFAQAEAWLLLTALGPTKRWLTHLTQQHAKLKASGLLGQMTPDLKTAGALSNFLGASAIAVYKRRQAIPPKSSPLLSTVSDPSLVQESDDAGGDASP
ncbi:MAG: hypothetical protein ACYCSN_17160 [Acidobacteriaceae bacterium]